MPVPTKTPARPRSRPSKTAPASATAWLAAASANWLTRSSMRNCGAGKCAAASKATTAPTGLARRSWYLPARRPIPERPSRSEVKSARVSLPSGETTPMPVTATRRTSLRLAGAVLLADERVDVGREVAHGLHLRAQLLLVGGHRDLERVLDAEEDLDHAQRVDVEVLEAGGRVHRLGLQLEVLREQIIEAREGGRGGVGYLRPPRQGGTRGARPSPPRPAEGGGGP